MAMIKSTQPTEPVAPPVVIEPVKLEKEPEPYVKPAGRDYGAEARGKVTFGAYQAAINSPGVLSFSASVEEYDKNIEKYAQLIIRKTWEAQNGK
jgi:hypothetical protein